MTADMTKERILDAAERLFGAFGFEGTSLRALTAEADVNLAAVNYHFGSKEGLLRAALARRVEPVNQERLRLLDAIEARAHGGLLPLEPILEALVQPLLQMGHSAEERGHLRRVAARLHAEPPELIGPLLVELFGEVGRRFFSALSRALPELAPEEVALRLEFALGVIVHWISDHSHVAHVPGLPETPADERTLVPRMVAFLSAGFRAPAPEVRRAAAAQGRGSR